MKVTYNWLKDFVPINISPRELAHKLTMAGLEVTALEEREGDFVFEIEITSNRPDWLSLIGIAREVAAITGAKLKVVTSHQSPAVGKSLQPFSLEIEDKKDCSLYAAKIISGVKVGPSPEWLRHRLELMGCRSVNNIVDITNYILFEYGQPLHAFDLDKLGGQKIIVRRAKDKEKIVTLDGQEKTLDSEVLVIADENRPVAIAGVMGGKDTEVCGSTKNILLEAAVFDPILIRRAKRKLALQSESAYRFERGINPEMVEDASRQALKLIQDLSAGRCVLAKALGKVKIEDKSISFSVKQAEDILGIGINNAQAKKILLGLGFKVKPAAGGLLKVFVPAHRPDVKLQVDLMEEIARISGFEDIPSTLPKVMPEVTTGQRRDKVFFAKETLIGMGLNEAITYSLVDKDMLEGFGIGIQAIEILNPLSKEQGVLRPALLPSLAAAVAYNLNQKQEYVNLFEIAPAFITPDKEELRLGIALCGTKPFLVSGGLVKDETGLLHLKGAVEIFFARLQIKNFSFTPDNDGAVNVHINQEQIGIMQKLKASAADRFGIKNNDVFLAEVNLERVFALCQKQKKFAPLPKYPGITRDISFILKDNLPAGSLLEAIKEKGRPFLEQAGIVDYYQGRQIPQGYRGLTISCVYRSREGTLTEAQINPVHQEICSLLTEQFGARLR
ncbi:MAG: phenylalanine--tRNA ligase subunit beta [Candidatus Omnitrophica bacterium]|nr:phenylalanine--tRNA ligase subunit beta [Candidatus Omnitrophota bacterium]